jgi:hypothetical protein
MSDSSDHNDLPELYLTLLKRVLTNHFGSDNGLRISYLLHCMDTSQPYDLEHVINIPYHEPDRVIALADDPDCQDNYRERIFGFPYTMIGRSRLDSLQWMIETIHREKIPGDCLEAGVWRGGASIFMRAMLKLLGDNNRKVFVADSFEGLPPPVLSEDKGLNFHLDRTLAVSLETVQKNFSDFDLLDDQVIFVKGWFEDTLHSVDTEGLAILRADGDLYKSTIDILDSLYHKVSTGGFIIIDDYGAIEVCRKAVTEFRNTHGIKDPIERIDWTGAYWRRSD